MSEILMQMELSFFGERSFEGIIEKRMVVDETSFEKGVAEVLLFDDKATTFVPVYYGVNSDMEKIYRPNTRRGFRLSLDSGKFLGLVEKLKANGWCTKKAEAEWAKTPIKNREETESTEDHSERIDRIKKERRALMKKKVYSFSGVTIVVLGTAWIVAWRNGWL